MPYLRNLKCKHGHVIPGTKGHGFQARMAAVRRHYKVYHPAEFAEMMRKARYSRRLGR